jgi:hypothetical protein
MAQKYLCQISADLWHKNIYVKFRQIYVKIVALAILYISHITLNFKTKNHLKTFHKNKNKNQQHLKK